MGGACVYLAPPFSTLVDFFHGKLVGRFLERGNRKAARMTVASSAFINLALLVIFKYTDFFIRSVNSLTGSGIPLLGLALPIGISFYTFQTMSYTIDVYRGEAPVPEQYHKLRSLCVHVPPAHCRPHCPLPGHCRGAEHPDRKP